MVELPGADHGWWVHPEEIARGVRRFLRDIWDGGEWDVVESDRVLATVLFTDIVGSTAKLAELGDRRWKELLQQHHALVRRHLVRFSGREIETSGDGFFAPASTGRRGRSDARGQSAKPCTTSGWRCARAFTPGRARYSSPAP